MKAFAQDQHIIYLDTDTPLGAMRLAACGQTASADCSALSGAWFLDQDDLPVCTDGWQHDPDHLILRQAQTELAEWFAGKRQSFDVVLVAHGTIFQQMVWRALRDLPFGVTHSYTDVARTIGRPKSARATAQAIGRNPLSIFIPCHRVVGRDTSLTGFSGGLERKQALLAHEGHRYHGHQPRVRRIDNGQLDLSW